MRRSIAQNKAFLIIYTIIAVAAYAAIALLIMFLVARSGVYPSGNDTMYHIYRGEWVFENIRQGNWYPIYDPDWYNGVEIMRYWPPMCPYFYALCMAIAAPFSTSYYGGYVVFVGMIFFLGAIVWFIIGMVKKRPFLGAVVAILWFFMPNNLYALFGEGNLARSVSMIFLPLFVFAVYQYLYTGKVRYLVIDTISFTLLALCHLGYAGMIALALLLYLVIDMFIFRRCLRDGRILISVLFGFALTGLYAIPSLMGGVTSVHTFENTKGYFQNLLISINPLYRYEVARVTFYFGLAAAILALMGALLSYKRSRPGFWVGIITLLMSSETMYNVVLIIPGGKSFWMLRFISIALCFILMSFLEWKTLKKPLILLMVVLLMADTIPSLPFVYGNRSGATAEENINNYAERTLIDKAKKITKQRLCILDESALGSMGSYIPVAGEDGVKTTFGAGWEAAETSRNIVNLNKGMAGGGYTYTFDRAMELGNDTVLVFLSTDKLTHISEIDTAANRVGYELVESNDTFRLYSLKKPHSDNWGVISKYNAISIGEGADIIARMFPYFKEGNTNVLDDYTFDDLKDYKIVYITSFEFRDRKNAEDLVVKLSEAGVKVIISADGVPEDRNVNGRVFLGVLSNPISFSQGFPLLETIEGNLDTDLFPAESREWNTCFCDGLDEVWGKVKDENYDIPFLGTVKNDNIIFIGLNLTYYYGQTRDAGVEKLLSKIMSLSTTELPERTIVPIEIEYDTNRIMINSEYDNVNTTLSYHNIFNISRADYEDNHLLIVPKGTTKIEMSYPYFVEGFICTIASAFLAMLYHVVIFIREIHKRKRMIVGQIEAQIVDMPEEAPEEKTEIFLTKMNEDEYERVEAEYSYVNEVLADEVKENYDIDIEYEQKNKNFDVEINVEDLDARDTEIDDYGTDIDFGEIDFEGYDYDDIYVEPYDDDDADEEKDDYDFNDIIIKE